MEISVDLPPRAGAGPRRCDARRRYLVRQIPQSPPRKARSLAVLGTAVRSIARKRDVARIYKRQAAFNSEASPMLIALRPPSAVFSAVARTRRTRSRTGYATVDRRRTRSRARSTRRSAPCVRSRRSLRCRSSIASRPASGMSATRPILDPSTDRHRGPAFGGAVDDLHGLPKSRETSGAPRHVLMGAAVRWLVHERALLRRTLASGERRDDLRVRRRDLAPPSRRFPRSFTRPCRTETDANVRIIPSRG